AASVAKPWPQAETRNLQPISKQGVNQAEKEGRDNPTKPINSPVSRRSVAYNPNPNSPKCASILSTRAADSAAVDTRGKYSIPAGSPFILAKGSRSVGRHRRKPSRAVLNK